MDPVQTVNVPAGTLETQMVILWSIAASTFLSLFGLIINFVRESRKRRWDLEDRQHQREVLAVATDDLATRISHGNKLSAESNELSATALNTANHFNQKIENLTRLFLGVEKDVKHVVKQAAGDAGVAASQAADATSVKTALLERVDAVTQETAERVKAIEQKQADRHVKEDLERTKGADNKSS